MAASERLLVLYGGYPEDDGNRRALLHKVRALVPQKLQGIGDVRGVDICANRRSTMFMSMAPAQK